MRPIRVTAAHKTDQLAELVCSNSLKSESENTAPWLLKQELRRMDSLLLRAADRARVPGGHALTVDRTVFAEEISNAIEREPLIELRREEAERIADGEITDHRVGTVDQRRAGRGDRPHHRGRTAVLL